MTLSKKRDYTRDSIGVMDLNHNLLKSNTMWYDIHSCVILHILNYNTVK